MASIALNAEQTAFLKRAAAANPDFKAALIEIDNMHRRNLVLSVSGKDDAGRLCSQRISSDILSSSIMITDGKWYELVLETGIREVLNRRVTNLIWRDKPGKWSLVTDSGHDLLPECKSFILCIY